MRSFLDRLYNGSLFLAGIFLVGVALLMICESILRKLGGYIPGAGDMVAWFSAAAGFLALPATFKRSDMVRVGVLLDSLPAKLRRVMLLANLFIAVIFTAYMVWAVGRYLHEGWRTEEMTQGMIETAVWIPQLSFLLGVVLLMVAVLDEVVVHLRAPAETLRAEKIMSIEDASKH